MPKLLSYLEKGRLEAGCDEAGRGCLAGPVFAAAVILPAGFRCPQLNDSKKLSVKTRNKIRLVIEEKSIAWAVASITPSVIDRINILRASIQAMHNALKMLSQKPEFILVDGNRFYPFETVEHECIIKGDGKFRAIAAASVLAKTHRDEYMEKMHLSYPHYGWSQNKGYPTKFHRMAIGQHGLTPEHRRSFKYVEETPVQLDLFKGKNSRL